MSATNIRFSVATHLMAALAFHPDDGLTSKRLTGSVNADPSLVRRIISQLSKAGLVTTTRGRHGHCTLSRPASGITLLEIYRAIDPPDLFAVHGYEVQECCPISRNIKGSLGNVLTEGRAAFEAALARKSLARFVVELGAPSI